MASGTPASEDLLAKQAPENHYRRTKASKKELERQLHQCHSDLAAETNNHLQRKTQLCDSTKHRNARLFMQVSRHFAKASA